MKLSSREQNIFIAVLVIVGMWLAYYFALQPFLDQRDEVKTATGKTQSQLNDANQLLAADKQNVERWKKMVAAGFMADPSATEGVMLHSIRDWAQDSGLSLPTLTPQRSEPEHGFGKVLVHATGTGNLPSLTRFLWHVQTTSIPARVVEMQLASRKDGTDDLNITLAISALCAAPKPATAPSPAAMSAKGAQ